MARIGEASSRPSAQPAAVQCRSTPSASRSGDSTDTSRTEPMQRSIRVVTTAIVGLTFAGLIAFAPSAFAAKPSGGSSGGGGHKGGSTGGTGTITLVLLDSTDGLPHYNQTITFNISTNATTQPWVHLQ